MFDLQARIHFHEEEFAVLTHDEFHRARTHIVHRLGSGDGGGTHGGASCFVKEGRGRFLQHFLVTTLRGTFTFVEVNDVAVRVAEHLEFDMTRMLHVAFEDHARVAKCAGGLALCRGQRVGKIFFGTHDAHAFAAATRCGLDHQRKTGTARLICEHIERLVRPMVTRHQRHLVLLHQRFGGRLGAHRVDAFRARADKGDARIGAGAREGGVLRKETIAGVDSLGAALSRHIEDDLAAQVRIRGAWPANRPCLVRQPHMLGVGVRFRVHGNGVDAEPPAGTDDAAGNLAAVGNEYALEHAASGDCAKSLKLADCRAAADARRSMNPFGARTDLVRDRGDTPLSLRRLVARSWFYSSSQ